MLDVSVHSTYSDAYMDYSNAINQPGCVTTQVLETYKRDVLVHESTVSTRRIYQVRSGIAESGNVRAS